jgi:hypothetical protein
LPTSGSGRSVQIDQEELDPAGDGVEVARLCKKGQDVVLLVEGRREGCGLNVS